ncbi:MAG: hypothetical protein R3E39_02700 [Anaerolineae bacterium]
MTMGMLPDNPEAEIDPSLPEAEGGGEADAPDVSPAENSPPVVNFEDLTLAQAIGRLFKAPGQTLDQLRDVLSPAPVELKSLVRPSASVSSASPRQLLSAARAKTVTAVPLSPEALALRQREALQFGVRLMALLVAFYGSSIMVSERTEYFGLNGGLPFLFAGFVIWIVGDNYVSWPALRGWWSNRDSREESKAKNGLSVHTDDAVYDVSLERRLIIAGAATFFSLLTLYFTQENKFTIPSLVTWPVSVGLWVAVFAPIGWGWRAIKNAVRSIRLPGRWTLIILIVIMLVAALFRLYSLNTIPSEMTSDHVEKILDAQRILDGNPQVFFPNNGGREAIQFYLMAIISLVPGLGMNFFTLKFLTVLEGLVSIPVLWWMGREMIGEDEPELGNAVGLALAALVAASYWHVMLSRLGLRIVLTVIVTGLLIIYFSRALRRNRRADFIKTGLVLGIGVYAYQAVRMLPVVVVVGVVLAVIFGLFRRRAHWSGT